jgi:putative phosphoesterase
VPVLGVRGNGDDGGGGRPICPEDPRMKSVRTLAVEGVRIGIVHDATLPEWPPHRTLESIMEHHFGSRVDVLVHGDTHLEAAEELLGVLLVNPGRPTFPRNLTRRLGTVACLRIEAQLRRRGCSSWGSSARPMTGMTSHAPTHAPSGHARRVPTPRCGRSGKG